MKTPDWYRPRGYLHFDVPVKVEFGEGLTPSTVAAHVWSPLIHYIKAEKRYKVKERKTVPKERPIMFASHRDACILSKYSADLVARLDAWYAAKGLDDTVIAYRSLGKSNYHFAKRVEDFVRSHASLTVMCFDVTDFFDNLDHKQLKTRLKAILGCDELPDDWYAVFKSVTQYKYVHLDELKKHDQLAERLKARKPQHPLATIEQVKALGVPIEKNPARKGIPQGTPISASFSNLYMTEFDEQMEAEARKRGALYQRYSDDILIACPKTRWKVLQALVEEKLGELALELQGAKTDIVHLHGESTLTFQYLGYELGHVDARLRLKSLSRQWRTAKRALKKAERIGLRAIAQGKAKQIYTRKLHIRFTGAGNRNFLGYAGRSAETLESPAIRKQAKRLRKFVHGELARMRGKPTPK
jgi:hypothetical protein